MRSSLLTILLTVVPLGIQLGACDADTAPVPVVLSAHVGDQLALPEGDEFEYVQSVEVSWEVYDAPSESAASLVEIEPGAVSLDADTRGRFIVDRWIKIGAAQRWTHRYFIDVTNAAPIPVLEGSTVGRVATVLSFDGTASFDSEGTDLSYHWRLSYRPKSSDATLANVADAAITLVPDVEGLYELELDVFDGELWAAEKATTIVNVQP